MLRAKTTKATLTILVLFFIASAAFSQQKPPQPGTYKIPGDPTTYIIAPDPYQSTDLVPAPDSSPAKPVAPKPPIRYFHLEFVVKTLDSGKVTGSHTYTMDANTDPEHQAMFNSQTTFRSEIQGHPTMTDSSHVHDQTQIDCNHLSLVGTDSVSLWVTALIDSYGASVETTYRGTFNPTVTLGKPTIVFSADGPTPNSKIQMEVTATPIHIDTQTKP